VDRFVLAKGDKQVSFEPMGTLRVMVDGNLLDMADARHRWRELRQQGYEPLTNPSRWNAAPRKARLNKKGWNPDWGANPFNTEPWWADLE